MKRSTSRAADSRQMSDACRDRKERIFTHNSPSVAKSITDAVVIKDGDLFFLTGPDGSIPLRDGHGYGLYYHDCRYLSGYELTLGGEVPEALFSGTETGFKALFQLTNRSTDVEGHGRLDEHGLGLSWKRWIHSGHLALYDLLTVTNFGEETVTVPLAFTLRADFADVFAIRGLWSEPTGEKSEPRWVTNDEVLLDYKGADGLFRRLAVAFSPEPERHEGLSAEFRLRLAPGEQRQIVLTLQVAEAEALSELPERACRDPEPGELEQQLKEATCAWFSRNSTVESDSLMLDRIVKRCFEDLHALRSELHGQEYFAAGLPWFGTLFGRDSIVTALQTLAFDSRIAEHTLRLLARYQGGAHDLWRDEQPGKILHELRVGELARTGAIPHTPYYGSVDATPLFLLLLSEHARWTGSLALFEELRSAVEAALGWIDKHGDLNGDGFVDYDSPTGHGLINQGWKDAGNSIMDADGTVADPPIALVEVQGYVYAAKRGMAELFERAGETARARALTEQAEELKQRINRTYWLEDEQFYAMALQRGCEPVRAIGSNAGHLLWSGVAEPKQAEAVARRLLADDMFSGWGVRTLASSEAAYNPIGYHLGTVWPHDNALIALGLRRYGFDAACLRIFSGLFEATTFFQDQHMPEVFSGFGRDEYPQPVPYPVACHPQAWAAGSWPLLLQTVLGLEADGFARTLKVVRPLLPERMSRLELRDVDIAGGKVDLHFERDGDGVKVTTLRATEGVKVVVEEADRGA